MKLLKGCLITVIILVLLFVAGVYFILFNPGFQKSIVEQQLQDVAEIEQFDYFKATLSSIRIENLVLKKDGSTIAIGEVDISYSFWAAFGGTLNIEKIIATGVELDLRAMEETKSVTEKTSTTTVATHEHDDDDHDHEHFDDSDEQPTQPFQGLFSETASPIKLYVGEVKVDAVVQLPQGRTVTVTASGGDIRPGATSQIDLIVSFVDETANADVAKADLKASLAVSQTEDAKINAVLLTTEVTSEGDKVGKPPALTLVLDLKQAAEKTEQYRLSLSETARPDAPLLGVDATFDPAANQLQGTAKLAVGHEQVAGYTPREKTPDFKLDGQATFSGPVFADEANIHAELESLKATLNFTFDELQRIRSELSGLGQVDLVADLDMAGDAKQTTLKTAMAELSSAQQGKLLELQTLQPITVPNDVDEDTLPVLTGELLRLSLNELPLSLIEPWVADMTLEGEPITTTLLLTGEAGGTYTVTAPQGFAINQLSVSRAGTELLDKLSIAANPTVKASQSKAEVSIPSLKLTSLGVPLMEGSLDATMNPQADGQNGSYAFKAQGDLAQLLRQPALAKFNNLTAGTFTTEGKVDFDQAGAMALKAELQGLMLRKPMKQVNRLVIDATGTLALPEKVTLKSPITLSTSEGGTELNLEASLEQEDDNRDFDLSLTGSQLDVDGVMLLVQAFKNPDYQEPGTLQAPTTPSGETLPVGPGPVRLGADGRPLGSADEKPFWSGYTGEAKLDIVKVYFQSYRLDAVKAELDLTETKLELDPLSADFAAAPLKSDTLITFTPGQVPYDLNSNLTFSQFDLGKFLVQENPGQTPPMTGLFNVTGTATGKGPTMAELMNRIMGQFSLEGRNGSLRMLAAAGQEDTAMAGSLILGGLSAFTGGDTQKISSSLNNLINTLREIPYERFAIQANREQNLDINLSELALVGPQIRLQGQGKVTHVEGTPLPQQPLRAEVNLMAKDNTAKMLTDLKLLQGTEPDEQGFYQAFSFPVTGTLSKPNYDNLNQLIADAGKQIIQQEIGKSGQTTESDDGQPQEQKSDTQKAIEAGAGLLDSLFNNRRNE
ncbi:MAG: hypothetical protein AAGF10_04085 [Verrucomicrobiota bacterium]